MAITTNADDLVTLVVAGEVAPALADRDGYHITREGKVTCLPGVGGICLDRFVGDACVGLAADHVEPGASVTNLDKRHHGDEASHALQVYAQIGNSAIITDGAAKGCIGTVVGKHAGVDHLIVHFQRSVLEEMDIGDPIRVHARGAGLQAPDHPDVALRNLDPRLAGRWLDTDDQGRLRVPVARIAPGHLLGSGLGSATTLRGDADLQLTDPTLVQKNRLDSLRFGDLVALTDTYDAYGRSPRPDHVSVGVVVHSDSQVAGHGPGLVTLLAAPRDAVVVVQEDQANVAAYLGLSRDGPGDHHAARLLERHAKATSALGDR